MTIPVLNGKWKDVIQVFSHVFIIIVPLKHCENNLWGYPLSRFSGSSPAWFPHGECFTWPSCLCTQTKRGPLANRTWVLRGKGFGSLGPWLSTPGILSASGKGTYQMRPEQLLTGCCAPFSGFPRFALFITGCIFLRIKSSALPGGLGEPDGEQWRKGDVGPVTCIEILSHGPGLGVLFDHWTTAVFSRQFRHQNQM